VDRDDRIADFSSRGPRAGDMALKPDLTAPGVGIVAARADGTAMGQPVDEYYTAESGTSMAAPHVAGVAALVAGARPGLDGTQLKALLMGTAVPQESLGAFAQGAGRVDVAAALEGPVVATPPSVSYGYFGFPHDHRDPVARTVTYTNLGGQPQTLTLEVDARNEETGEPAPEGSLTLSTATLTVPAGGAASVTLTLDTRRPGAGRRRGRRPYPGRLPEGAGDVRAAGRGHRPRRPPGTGPVPGARRRGRQRGRVPVVGSGHRRLLHHRRLGGQQLCAGAARDLLGQRPRVHHAALGPVHTGAGTVRCLPPHHPRGRAGDRRRR